MWLDNLGALRQRGMVFIFPCYHIQNCRSSKKIGRKDKFERFFFSLGIQPEKKNRDEKIAIFFSNQFLFLPFLGLELNFGLRFFFPAPNPEGKKKPVKSGSGEEGRRTYVITWKNKNHTPLYVPRIATLISSTFLTFLPDNPINTLLDYRQKKSKMSKKYPFVSVAVAI